MRRLGYGRSSRSLPDGWMLRAAVVLLIIAGSALPQARRFWYLDNGPGGSGWRLGSSEATGFPAHQPRSLPESRWLALHIVNRDRQLNGLRPLVEDASLAQAAQLHAEDMLRRNFYAHRNPDGLSPTDRYARVGGQGGVGENINQQLGVYGITLTYRLVEHFHKSWMYSQGHRENLLDPDYARFGYGIAVDRATGRAYAVQKFALSAL